jgi:hypothetical protein
MIVRKVSGDTNVKEIDVAPRQFVGEHGLGSGDELKCETRISPG